MAKGKILFLGIVIFFVVAALLFAFYKRGYFSSPLRPDFKYVEGYSDGSFLYACSKPIWAKLQNVPVPYPRAESYVPVNLSEAKLYCHSTAVIENDGKIKILKLPEVNDLISKYDPKYVTIKALEFKYIEDKNYVNRLLPDFKDREIGCIIVLETPNEKLVFLEDEKLEVFEKLDSTTFELYLSKATQEDKDLFYSNLH